MSKKFYLIDKSTGEKFKPNKHHYVVLYDSGYPAFVETDYYTHITPVDMSKWELVFKERKTIASSNRLRRTQICDCGSM